MSSGRGCCLFSSGLRASHQSGMTYAGSIAGQYIRIHAVNTSVDRIVRPAALRRRAPVAGDDG